MLCFTSVTKTMLILHYALPISEQCLHSVKAFSVSHFILPVKRLEVRMRLGGDATRQVTQLTKEIFHVT